ncbi:cation diffusion facilitator family transporter [Kiritimatiella glycovorans]|uniref:Cadmium, cobalt and zinc/H(+)-K(+) antiporter n=1 Tax=Kiritimatiella glycovorans TaxID=1307763 RepID=A0A0G3EL19_9BACT|nr:cation diffusion facilitator family transporter [Kiritimatiella glycovorans]AKJ64819.1 Cadmium, cobalt and zinc/H(+)-K(+) antiporter [Kiritimatiella glycovorans]
MDELLQYRSLSQARLLWSMAITVTGMAIEIVGGLLTGSLALLSDAGHMFTHVFALGISAIALRMASSKPCHHRTFGLLRAEVLAAYTNALFLFAVTATIAYEGVARLLNPQEVLTREMLVVAAIGLAVNVASILLLHGHGKNISVRSALVHMAADTVSSVVIVIGALVIAVTDWTWIDPLLSIGIAMVILAWAWGLFRDTSRILLEIAPSRITTADVERFVAAECPQVESLKRVRIWSITDDVTAFTAELVMAEGVRVTDCTEITDQLAKELRHRFGFSELTLQTTASGEGQSQGSREE